MLPQDGFEGTASGIQDPVNKSDICWVLGAQNSAVLSPNQHPIISPESMSRRPCCTGHQPMMGNTTFFVLGDRPAYLRFRRGDVG
jgi:hypothetical protein